MTEKPPLIFEAHLGMLRPANIMAEEAMQELRGRVRVEIKGGLANQRRRSLYWCVAALVAPLLNEANNLTLSEQDLHDITRKKLGLFDEVILPSGEVFQKLRSTKNTSMNEAERAMFTTQAIGLWSTWTGVDVTALRSEAERAAA